MSVPDLFAEGLARGWKTHDGSQLTEDLRLPMVPCNDAARKAVDAALEHLQQQLHLLEGAEASQDMETLDQWLASS